MECAGGRVESKPVRTVAFSLLSTVSNVLKCSEMHELEQ